jgi:hypothetical protein
MATTNGNRKLLDLKRWEMVSPSPAASTAGASAVMSQHFRQDALFIRTNTSAFLYSPFEDGWVDLPSPALAGTFGVAAATACGSFSVGTATGVASLTATGGSTTTIVTNQTLARDLRGFSVHILAGPNAGVTLEIQSNTIGANATITVAAQASAFSASTVYRLVTPVWYVLGAGTLASGAFKKYDFATNTWTTLTSGDLPASLATDGRLIATPSWVNGSYLAFGSGTATGGGASTLTQTGKTWAVNQWTNSQVRIVSGTGAGQIRSIASNTADTLTASVGWTTQPDATSVYQISGNDNFLYYTGNGSAGAVWRYSISSNTWTVLTPSPARGAPTSGMSGNWVYGVTATEWTNESNIQNGRYIYSFRGGSAVLERYDIAGNAWAAISYAPASQTFAAGTKYVYIDDFLYIQQDATGRWFRYDFLRNAMDGWGTMLYPNATAIIGNTAFASSYYDGATRIDYVYMILNSSNIMLRQMVI